KRGVPFVALPGNIFLPFMGIILQDVRHNQYAKADKMMPATQMVFLELLYMGDEDSMLKSEVANKLNLAKTSITRAFLMDMLFNATAYATGHCKASSYFAFCFFIAAMLSSVSFITSIMAKLTPYISTNIISRIVMKIGNGNLFLYSAIFTLQPKYCSSCFFI
ncbi:MAG: hypothetical protein II310_10050, partial [Selenomonadaceae bacterium]|nr:hypothetical protein [Selenomonadaceae bacterium]